MRAKAAKKNVAKPRRKRAVRRAERERTRRKKPRRSARNASAKKIAPRKVAPKSAAPKKTAPKSAAPKKIAPKKKRVARRPPVDHDALAALEAEVRSLRSARRRLEQRLTEAVQEIGTLRQFELRAQMFENELAKRDHEVARLREELAERLGGASIVSAPN